MHWEYHKGATLREFIVGTSRSGVLWCKRYTRMDDGSLSGYPLWFFELPSIGMDGIGELLDCE